jgi:hypothetical protein
MDNEHRRQFAETLFGILNAAEIESFSSPSTDWPKIAVRVIQSLGNIDRDTKEAFYKILMSLFQAAKNNIEMLLPENTPPKS